MRVLIELIDQVAFLVYAAGLLGALFLLLRFVAAQREVVRARHWAERESASARAYRYGFVALALLLIIAAVVFIDTQLAPLVSPMDGDLPPGFQIGQPAEHPVADALPTPTLEHLVIRVAPAQSTPSSAERLAPTQCPTEAARITSPSSGATVWGRVEIGGSAEIPNFQFYKLEFAAGPDPAEWAYLGGAAEPVSEGRLWSWDTGGLAAGLYLLRLTVVDHSGNYPPPCDLRITLEK